MTLSILIPSLRLKRNKNDIGIKYGTYINTLLEELKDLNDELFGQLYRQLINF